MLEQWLYQRLRNSPHFKHIVRQIHAAMNNLPPPPPLNSPHKQFYNSSLKPTSFQILNAWRIIWVQEMFKSFTFRK